MPATPRAIRFTFRCPTPRALARRAFGLVLVMTAVGACARRPAADTGLNTDVALAGQLQRQSMPALVAVPEPGRAQRPDSFREVVRPTARAITPLLRTHVITRTATGAPVRPEASIVGREHHDASAGEVVATAPAERRSTAAGATYSSPVSTSPTRASTTDAGGYGASAPVYGQSQAHAGRDGAFGSVAGAILGAAAGGHNRVRGALIGAVAGGALGAIYGGSVDRTVPTYGLGGRAMRAYRSY